MASGCCVDEYFPINKPLWTSSYVLYTSGLAILFLMILIWVLDIKKWTAWAYPFRVFGLNPLVSYVLSVILIKVCISLSFGEDSNIYSWSYEHAFAKMFSPEFGSLMQALLFTGFVWLFAWMLYRKGRIIKL